MHFFKIVNIRLLEKKPAVFAGSRNGGRTFDRIVVRLAALAGVSPLGTRSRSPHPKLGQAFEHRSIVGGESTLLAAGQEQHVHDAVAIATSCAAQLRPSIQGFPQRHRFDRAQIPGLGRLLPDAAGRVPDLHVVRLAGAGAAGCHLILQIHRDQRAKVGGQRIGETSVGHWVSLPCNRPDTMSERFGRGKRKHPVSTGWWLFGTLDRKQTSPSSDGHETKAHDLMWSKLHRQQYSHHRETRQSATSTIYLSIVPCCTQAKTRVRTFMDRPSFVKTPRNPTVIVRLAQ